MTRSSVLTVAALFSISATLSAAWVHAPFIRGDANRNGEVDVSDAVAMLDYLFQGSSNLDGDCLAAADANADQALDISDPIFILNYLFLGGTEPPAPFPAEGLASEESVLDCQKYEPDPPIVPTTPVVEYPALDLFPVENSWNSWGLYDFGTFTFTGGW
jgi:hypothetical protein